MIGFSEVFRYGLLVEDGELAFNPSADLFILEKNILGS